MRWRLRKSKTKPLGKRFRVGLENERGREKVREEESK